MLSCAAAGIVVPAGSRMAWPRFVISRIPAGQARMSVAPSISATVTVKVSAWYFSATPISTDWPGSIAFRRSSSGGVTRNRKDEPRTLWPMRNGVRRRQFGTIDIAFTGDQTMRALDHHRPGDRGFPVVGAIFQAKIPTGPVLVARQATAVPGDDDGRSIGVEFRIGHRERNALTVVVDLEVDRQARRRSTDTSARL